MGEVWIKTGRHLGQSTYESTRAFISAFYRYNSLRFELQTEGPPGTPSSNSHETVLLSGIETDGALGPQPQFKETAQ